MSYSVLFFIIGVVAFIGSLVLAKIIEALTNEEAISYGLIVGIVFAFLFISIGLGFQITTVGVYRANNYDLRAVYNEYESTPGCICVKNTEEVDCYYSYTPEYGVQTNSSCVDNIIVEKLVNGKRKVKYTTYVPSEKALSQKIEWEKMETFRLQKDEESNQNEEQE